MHGVTPFALLRTDGEKTVDNTALAMSFPATPGLQKAKGGALYLTKKLFVCFFKGTKTATPINTPMG